MEINSGWIALGMILFALGGFFAGRGLKFVLQKMVQLSRGDTRAFRSTLLELLSRTVLFPMTTLGLCFAAKLLELSDAQAAARDDGVGVLYIILVCYVVYQLVELMDYWMKRITAKTAATLGDMMIPLVRKTMRTLVVLLGLVQIAVQLSDKPLTSIIAGLGVGGLAIALAAQDTIKNFFGSLVIFADHPFQLGERVVVDGEDGTVEDVGMRSTRIRTLDGHLVTVPNGELANKMIRNISKRPYIKRVANIGLTYDTSPEKVALAISIIKEFLDEHNEKMHPDFPSRVFFNNFNAYSLNIMVIYWFAPPDYWAFMEFDQAFNFTLLHHFNEEGIEFAFPTQTLHLQNGEASV
jgi:MscS family membrane protein